MSFGNLALAFSAGFGCAIWALKLYGAMASTGDDGDEMATIGEEMLQARIDRLEQENRQLLENIITAEAVIERYKLALRSNIAKDISQARAAVLNLNSRGAVLYVTHIHGYLGTVGVVQRQKSKTPK